MAQQGLFTQLPSVDELLQQRNKGATDLQQTLMTNAAQGARDPAKARAVSFLGSTLGRALGDSMSGEDKIMAERKADIEQQTEMQGKFGQSFTQGTPQHQLKLANELIQMGYVEKGTELFEVGQAGLKEQQAKEAANLVKEQEQKLRDNVAATAEEQGLTQLAATVRNGGDLGEAQETLAEYEQTQIIAKGGRAGRVQLAATYSKGQPFVNQIKSGEFDKMSDVTFLAMLKGKQAKNEAYRDQQGKTRIYSVDEQGKVLDSASNTWVYPSELNLTTAPQQTQVINELDVAAKSLEGVAIANYQNLNTLANDALLAIDVNTTSQEIFDEGIISGKFAEIKMAYAETLIAAGMASEDVEKVVANTQTYLAHRGIAVANVIKAFGAGTGLSDQDRKYATNIVGGTITMNTGAMKKLLEIERKGYMGLIKTHNKAVDKVVNRLKNTSAEDKAQTALDFYIELPADYVSKVNRQSMSSAGVLQFLPPKAPVAGPFPYMQP